MSLFNLPVEAKPQRPESMHPWKNTIRDELANKIKGVHNSVTNEVYPKPKERVPLSDRVTFTVIGNRVTKEFIYCVNLVRGLHKYRWKKYDTPVIRGCTGIEWPDILRDLQIRYGGESHCLVSQVAVIKNDTFIGGEKELKDLIEAKYIYHLALNYHKDSEKHFIDYLKCTGRPCAYMHISIDGNPIGTLIFMLYSDVAPVTCENFLRLCRSTRGGYGGTNVHRIVKDGWIQCGGFGLKDTKMDCENFIVPHTKRGVLGMANAGRHIDCSTQFFVLLQPHEWMKSRFVAFGQLIDGEETLKKIEAIETYYEAPTANIIIYKAGVLNLDCHDIRITRGTLEYLDGHVEDLVTIGDIFYEMLMQQIFLEIEFRELQAMEPTIGEGGEDYGEAFKDIVDEYRNIIKKNIDATRRYIRKTDKRSEGKFVDTYLRRKQDLENQLDTNEKQSKIDTTFNGKSRTDSPKIKSRDLSANRAGMNQDNVNNEFDVEDYSYEPEQYSYSAVKSFSEEIPKATKPYYIALTDVPYPEEVDSNFNLKRMLQGDYCLESDLDPNNFLKKERTMIEREVKINELSFALSSYAGGGIHISSEESSTSRSSSSMDSEERKELENYISLYAEKVSFSGNKVRNIARSCFKSNPVEERGSRECYNDEDIRKIRMAIQELKSRADKKVSISAQPWLTHSQINRRQTAYPEPHDSVDESVEEENELKDETVRRKVLIRTSGIFETEQSKFIRRATAYGKSDDTSIDEEDKEAEEKIKYKAGKIRISELKEDRAVAAPSSRRVTEVGRKSLMENQSQPRQSVLVRLLEDLAIDDEDEVPTLKDFKPQEVGKTKKIQLAMSDSEIPKNCLIRRDTTRQILREMSEQQDLGAALTRKRPSSVPLSKSVAMIDKSPERHVVKSLRGLHWHRTRPTLTVSQYQQLNQDRREEAKKQEANKVAIVNVTANKNSFSDKSD